MREEGEKALETLKYGDIIEFDASIIGMNQNVLGAIGCDEIIKPFFPYIFKGFAYCCNQGTYSCPECRGRLRIDINHREYNICAYWNTRCPIRILSKNKISEFFDDLIEDL